MLAFNAGSRMIIFVFLKTQDGEDPYYEILLVMIFCNRSFSQQEFEISTPDELLSIILS